MRKVCVVVTSRASYARIKSALRAIQHHPDLELQLVVGASALLVKYGSAIEYITRDGFDVAGRVYMVLEGENPVTMAKTTGIGLMELTTILDNLQPDVVLTVADRYETLATAIAASYMNVPVAHVQGGEVTGSIDEKVRHAVTKLANLHFVANSHCAERVIRMGESPSAVHVTGCPSIDLAAEVMSELRLSFDPFERYGGAGPRLNLDEQPYLVVMQHAVTTEYDVTPDQIRETVAAILDLQMPTLWFWPNVDAGSDWVSKGIRLMREHENPDFIHFFRNMPPEDFLRVLAHAACIVGNSSAAIREGSFLGVPAVNIGTRQAGRDRGRNVMDVEYDRQQIISAVQQQVHHGHYPSEHIYGDGRAGERIAEHLATAKLTVEKRLYY